MDRPVAARLIVSSRCAHGEGVLWCERRQALFWVDIDGARLWMHSPADGATRNWSLPDRPGCIALATSGELLLVLAKAMFRADLDAALGAEATTLALSHLADVEPNEPRTRSNDGRADRHGNFVFGTMDESAEKSPVGNFYQYSAAHGLRRLPLPGAAIPNSICFSADGRTLYFCDSMQDVIQRCDYEPDAAWTGTPHPFARVDPAGGAADGSALDAGGGLWNARWGGARVVRHAPDGNIDRVFPVPVPQPSCCTIGGAGLDTLYVITSPQGLDDAAREAFPESGSLYAIPLGRACGLPESRVALP
ncbi:SMP-30/gluconolactonase/LRE family protein [Pseudoxanthomonas daejeonensis]|uniref:SMP-30/gluconolactonase/LRE family protein n=1 Tax=Pseudoxanthomonas daejeonensis TaxID=266062 RepID=UPI001F543A8F|nr:SMP-30/gluconolactonase/LRE family protein [Pseudoxanthomonas daejeonensis]UNK56845.1 SMP-30/gluconolactonase/LRE family protein [Pseudoxanthomonas daejeonensis]